MDSKLKKSLSYIIRGGVATSAMDTLALGPTLIAYAKLLGAGSITFGILNSIPYLGNLMHFLVVWLLQKGHSVKKISIVTSFISRPFYLFIALLAFCPNSYITLPLLIVFLIGSYLTGCISGGCWMPWMKSLVPEKIIGHFFSERFKLMQVAKIACFLASAAFLKYVKDDYPEAEIYAYSVLFVLAFVIGMYGAYTFIHVEDQPVTVNAHHSLTGQFLKTLKNKPFRQLLLCLSLINFSFTFITPFITVFMLNKLNIAISDILLLTLTSQVSYIFIIKKLGKISDRLGCHKVLFFELITTTVILIALMGINQIESHHSFLITCSLYAVHIVLGFTTAAWTLGMNNASLLYIKQESSAVYLTVNSVFKSLAGAIGSLFAGLILPVCLLIGNHTHLLSNEKDTDGWFIFFICGMLLTLAGMFLVKYRLDVDPRHQSSPKA